MKIQLGTLFLTSTVLIGPAIAQNAGPNPAQAAAKTLLQAADKAIGASSVKSFTEAATGWMGYPGQQFAQGDLPRSDLKSYNFTADLAGKSAKTEYVRVQGNQPIRGGGAGFPVRGEASKGSPFQFSRGTRRIASSDSGSTRSASSRLP